MKVYVILIKKNETGTGNPKHLVQVASIDSCHLISGNTLSIEEPKEAVYRILVDTTPFMPDDVDLKMIRYGQSNVLDAKGMASVENVYVAAGIVKNEDVVLMSDSNLCWVDIDGTPFYGGNPIEDAKMTLYLEEACAGLNVKFDRIQDVLPDDVE